MGSCHIDVARAGAQMSLCVYRRNVSRRTHETHRDCKSVCVCVSETTVELQFSSSVNSYRHITSDMIGGVVVVHAAKCTK